MKRQELKRLTDQELLHLIREKDNKACGFLFLRLTKYFRRYLKPWTRDARVAKSLAIEVIAILIEMPKEPVLRSKLINFSITIGRNQWLLIQRKESRFENRPNWFFDEFQSIENVLEQTMISEKHKYVNNCLQQVSEKCRKLLSLFCQGFSPDEVCSEFDYSSKKVYQVKKSKCIERLRSIVISSPEYHELFES